MNTARIVLHKNNYSPAIAASAIIGASRIHEGGSGPTVADA